MRSHSFHTNGNQVMSCHIKGPVDFFFFKSLFRTWCILSKCPIVELYNQSLPHSYDSNTHFGEMVRRAGLSWELTGEQLQLMCPWCHVSSPCAHQCLVFVSFFIYVSVHSKLIVIHK